VLCVCSSIESPPFPDAGEEHKPGQNTGAGHFPLIFSFLPDVIRIGPWRFIGGRQTFSRMNRLGTYGVVRSHKYGIDPDANARNFFNLQEPGRVRRNEENIVKYARFSCVKACARVSKIVAAIALLNLQDRSRALVQGNMGITAHDTVHFLRRDERKRSLGVVRPGFPGFGRTCGLSPLLFPRTASHGRQKRLDLPSQSEQGMLFWPGAPELCPLSSKTRSLGGIA